MLGSHSDALMRINTGKDHPIDNFSRLPINRQGQKIVDSVPILWEKSINQLINVALFTIEELLSAGLI